MTLLVVVFQLIECCLVLEFCELSAAYILTVSLHNYACKYHMNERDLTVAMESMHE